MPKKLIFVFMVAVFLSSVRVVFASLLINEITYDLSGADSSNSKSREWVEIYNTDSVDVSIDASKWRLYDGTGNRTINGGVDFVIPASSYVVFAGNKDNFLADHVGFSGIVYDTGITSLNNTGATIKLLDQDSNVVDSVTYASSQGAAGDGNSLQRSPSGWIAATPTPGAVNQSSSSSSTTSSGGGGIGLTSGTTSTTSSSSSSTESKSKNTEESKIKTEIKSSNLAFVNSPIKLEATSYGYSKEILHFGKYFWNFGDGDYKEGDVMATKTISHTYFYPGDYTVTLEYYSNAYGETPDTVTRFSVKVIPADLLVSRVGVDPDFFIEILNNTNYDADISRWFLVSDKKSFIFPKNTIIDSKNKIILSGRITNFTSSDQTSLKLLNTEGAVVFDFGRNTKNIDSGIKNVDLVKARKSNIPEISKIPTMEEENPLENTEADTLPSDTSIQLAATAINSNTESPAKSSNMPIVYFALLVGCSSSLVYFIRRNKTSKNPGDDFEILE